MLASEELPSPYFGEGVVAWKDRLYQLTWKDENGFIYGLNDFSPRGTFEYNGEGWGLTHDGTSIIMSDGTPILRFLDPETMAVKSMLTVTANGCPVANLNELEWVRADLRQYLADRSDRADRSQDRQGHELPRRDRARPRQCRRWTMSPTASPYIRGASVCSIAPASAWPKLYEVPQQGAKQPASDAA